MSDAFSAVDAAINEVIKARTVVRSKKTKQIASSDERDQLKAVAFSWFRTHRLVVASHNQGLDLSRIDSSYQVVLDATGGHAARVTYLNALLQAKNALVEVRGIIAASGHSGGGSSTTDAPPNFSPLASDPKMQSILQKRWHEVQLCIGTKANLAATVMMGGLLESLLLARINASPNKPAIFKATMAPRDKTGKTLALGDWKLINMVEVGHELTWITRSAKDVGHVLREFRNYIHPHKEYTDGVIIFDEDARMFWEVTKSIARHVIASVGKSP